MSKWKFERTNNSLPEVYSSISVTQGKNKWKKFLAFLGPGLMVAVGYMDPGNWATDIEGGARFGYTLLSVILISNIFAIFLQYLSLKLGIVTNRDLAQACKDHYSKPTAFILWILAEIAIAATDLAEVIGSAIAIHLLFGIPITIGIIITVIDVFILLLLQNRGFRYIEAFVGGLIFIISFCFVYNLLLAQPEIGAVLNGLIPKVDIIQNADMLYIGIGILGATVMPHNLYLHSSIVQTRAYGKDNISKKEAIKYATLDSTISLLLAFFINAAILILAAATFHKNELYEVTQIEDAYKMLEPLLGASLAPTFFAIALLAAGQNSTLTGTLSGQIVMEGFINLKIKPWARRLITRLIAIIPALIVSIWMGERGTDRLLIFSQVILSLQLSFAVIPLVLFTSDKDKMGEFANSKILTTFVWSIALIIISFNLYMLSGFIR
ncbi:MAG: Nramp family divalent metal transporter [Chitinophagales bacterium]|nr:Nramp family divalent metal transporter [Chitinophagales bacterium]